MNSQDKPELIEDMLPRLHFEMMEAMVKGDREKADKLREKVRYLKRLLEGHDK